MQVRVAKTAGFCFGVRRAVEMVAQEAAAGSGAVTLGPIIHNRHVVEEFAAQGVRPVETPGDAPEGGTVIIRSHGVGRAVYDELERRGTAGCMDATCPFVKRIHTIVAAGRAGGAAAHHHRHKDPSGGPGDRRLVRRSFDLRNRLRSWKIGSLRTRSGAICRLSMVCQTTSPQNFYGIHALEIVKKECTNCKIFDTICEATENRQE